MKVIELTLTVLLVVGLESCSKQYRIQDDGLRSKVQLIDSVSFNSTENIYWYRLDIGIKGYSDCKLVLASSSSNIDNEMVFFVSDHITDIEVLSQDEILIELQYDSYKIIKENIPSNIKINTRLGGNIGKTYRYRLDTTLIPPPN